MDIKDRIKALETIIKKNPDVPEHLKNELKQLKKDLNIDDDFEDASEQLKKEISELKKEISELKQKSKDYSDDLLDRYSVQDGKPGDVCKADKDNPRRRAF